MDHPKSPCCPHNPSLNWSRRRPDSPRIPLSPGPFFQDTPPFFSQLGVAASGPASTVPSVFTTPPTPFAQLPLLLPVTLMNPNWRGATTPSWDPYATPKTNFVDCATTPPVREEHSPNPVSTHSLTKMVVPKNSQNAVFNLHPRRRLLLIGCEEPPPKRHFRRKRTREIRLEGPWLIAKSQESALTSASRAGLGLLPQVRSCGKRFSWRAKGETPNEVLSIVTNEN